MPALALALVLSSFGCGGGGSDIDLQPVKGTVTMDDKPLADARVIFTPKGGGRPAFGATDSNGRYELGYSTRGMGTPPGEYVVSIRTHREADEDPKTGEMIPAAPETVPAIYHSPSTLEVTVPGGSYDFALKSGEVVQPVTDVSGQ